MEPLENTMTFAMLKFQERKSHKHGQIRGTVPGLGGCQKMFHVFFFAIPYGEEKHIWEFGEGVAVWSAIVRLQ